MNKRGLLAGLVLALLSLCATAGDVRLSRNSVCHDESSPHYKRLKTFSSFASMEDCLAAGGRRPGSKATTTTSTAGTSSERYPAYDRDQFKHWSDADGDCKSTRHELLADLSTGNTSWSSDGCRVVRGRWLDPYSGKTYYEAKALDIDHVVPLAWAWAHGAWQWSDAQRERFANDAANLMAVDAGLNREKGASGPTEWLPPDRGFQCQYVTRFLRVVKTYKLALNPDEQQALNATSKRVCGQSK